MRRTQAHSNLRWIFVGLSLFMPFLTQGQSDGYVTNSNLRGVSQAGSYQFTGIDNINLLSGTVNLHIPLGTRKGRGSDESYEFVYSSKIWVARPIPDPQYPVDPNSGQMNVRWIAWEPSNDAVGLVVGTSTTGGRLDWTEQWYTCTYGQGYQIWVRIQSNFMWRQPDGAVTQFPNRKIIKQIPNFNLAQCYAPMAGPPPPPPEEREIYIGNSDQGTMQLDISGNPYVVRYKNGRIAHASSDQMNPWTGPWKDSNGNIVGFYGSTAGDTLGRLWVTPSDGQATAPPPWPPQSPVPYQTQFPTALANPNCYFQHQGERYLSSRLNLSNGKVIDFEYDSVFGELTKVSLPTGGYIRYIYQTFAQMDDGPIATMGGCSPGALDSRRVVERRVSVDGTTELIWRYNYVRDPMTGGLLYTEVTDPLGNVSKHVFSGQHETLTEFRDSSGTLLRRVANVWNEEFGPVQLNQDATATYGSKNARLVSTTTTLVDSNQVSKTETVYDQWNYVEPGFVDPYTNVNSTRMNVVETREYDYGAGAPGPLLRRTTFTYANDDNRHIWGLLTSKEVYDGIGNRKAQTEYSYDSTPITATSGVVQHDYTNYPYTMTTRGNLTETRVWRNTDNAWLTTKNWYDDLGNVIQTQDPLGHNTFFSYADSWTTLPGGSACAPAGGSARAFVTQVTNHQGHVTSSKYYSCSGFVGSTTDANGHVPEPCRRLDLLDHIQPHAGWIVHGEAPLAPRLVLERICDLHASALEEIFTEIDKLKA